MTRILSSLCLCAAGLGAQPNDWTIVPGERVGPITRSSTIVSLRQQFGAANVRETKPPAGGSTKGFYRMENGPAAIVYLESPSRALAVYWQPMKHTLYSQPSFRNFSSTFLNSAILESFMTLPALKYSLTFRKLLSARFLNASSVFIRFISS